MCKILTVDETQWSHYRQHAVLNAMLCSGCVSLDALVADLTCGQPAVEPYVSLKHIVSDVEARKHSWPWMCLIFVHSMNGGVRSICAGSVINSRHILTAAVCL